MTVAAAVAAVVTDALEALVAMAVVAVCELVGAVAIVEEWEMEELVKHWAIQLATAERMLDPWIEVRLVVVLARKWLVSMGWLSWLELVERVACEQVVSVKLAAEAAPARGACVAVCLR